MLTPLEGPNAIQRASYIIIYYDIITAPLPRYIRRVLAWDFCIRARKRYYSAIHTATAHNSLLFHVLSVIHFHRQMMLSAAHGYNGSSYITFSSMFLLADFLANFSKQLISFYFISDKTRYLRPLHSKMPVGNVLLYFASIFTIRYFAHFIIFRNYTSLICGWPIYRIY